MAVYSFHELMVSLSIRDIPVGYVPPRGPAVYFHLSYAQREGNQPQIFYYSNFGPKWTFDFMSHVIDNPGNLSQPVDLYLRGGGKEVYANIGGGTSDVHPDSHAFVVRTASSPIRYERRLPDGSVEVFAQPDGAATYSRRVFMTEWIDPQGNKLTFTYDDALRLVAITDAIGQVTTLSHDLTADPLKITRVTDPFGRFAAFEYDDYGHLIKITDVLGLTSQFTYGSGDFIQELTTPYGTTTFAKGENASYWRSLEATDPLGGTERLEYRYVTPSQPATDPASSVPTGMAEQNSQLNLANSFFWDKRASALFPGDYSKAHISKWLRGLSGFEKVKHSEKAPLEGRVWYAYGGSGSSNYIGPEWQPSKVGRVLDDGQSQIYRYEYNSKGKVTRQTDPLGRETVYEYNTNEIDVLRVKQKNPASPGGYDLLQSSTYNPQGLPLTTTDAAGQTTTYTYNAQGKILTVTAPPRAGITENRTTTYSYDTNGRLERVTGPAAGAVASFTYDGYGRIRTVTDSDSYILTYDYDAMDRVTKVTYPDGTFDETVFNRLDAERKRDRLGRWTHTFYDALRRVVSTRDPVGRTTTQQWCTCGSLDKVIDAVGNATSWERDVQGRVKRETRADSSEIVVAYENTTSRLKQMTDAKNQVIVYAYFNDDNLKQITYTPSSTPSVSFTYDPSFNRLEMMVDGTGTTSYGYHPVGATPPLGATRLASVDGPLSNDTVSYHYDELGRVRIRSINSPGSVDQTSVYDALGRLTTQTNALGQFARCA